MSKPFVTVLVDTYNHQFFIEDAISSVLKQDFPASETEILVVDDGPTDNTAEIIQKFVPPVRLLRKVNGEQPSPFNAGILEARGEIIPFVDGDDWWAQGKLTAVTEAFAADAEVGLIGVTEVYPDEWQRTEVQREVSRFRLTSIELPKHFVCNGASWVPVVRPTEKTCFAGLDLFPRRQSLMPMDICLQLPNCLPT